MLYDYIMFFNENDVLDIRLNQHAPYVDKFVIVEAGQTHMGDTKPYHFDKERFKHFGDKIIYRQIDSLDDMIEEYQAKGLKTWADSSNVHHHKSWLREEHQRNYCFTAFDEIGVKDDDYVICGDLDEIIQDKQFEKAFEILSQEKDRDALVTFEWGLRAYKLNLFSHVGHGSNLNKYGVWKHIPPNVLRAHDIYTHSVGSSTGDPAGWHFTFLSKTKENLLYKYNSFTHSYHCKVELPEGFTELNEEAAEAKVFKDYNLKPCPTDTLPKYITDNMELFKDYIWEEKQ